MAYNANGFEFILRELPPEFECVKALCRELQRFSLVQSSKHLTRLLMISRLTKNKACYTSRSHLWIVHCRRYDMIQPITFCKSRCDSVPLSRPNDAQALHSPLLQLLVAIPLLEELLASLPQFSANNVSMAINDDFHVITHWMEPFSPR